MRHQAHVHTPRERRLPGKRPDVRAMLDSLSLPATYGNIDSMERFWLHFEREPFDVGEFNAWKLGEDAHRAWLSNHAFEHDRRDPGYLFPYTKTPHMHQATRAYLSVKRKALNKDKRLAAGVR
jgi:hypothetical protein